MGGIHKHKMANKRVQEILGEEEDDIFFGDAATDASLYANLFADLAKTGGAIASAELQKKSAAEKEKAAKEANKERDSAVTAAADARKRAYMAAAEAKVARDQATTARARASARPGDKALQDAATAAENMAEAKEITARNIDAEAKGLEAKAAFYMQAGAPGGGLMPATTPIMLPPQPPKTGMPMWGWAAIGVGAVGLLGVVFMAARRK